MTFLHENQDIKGPKKVGGVIDTPSSYKPEIVTISVSICDQDKVSLRKRRPLTKLGAIQF